ncbi:MAG TPA: VOC family protein [Dehalococcoidia bacterium]|nr:VOC family protein [Dehalococcoidia bacterium]
MDGEQIDQITLHVKDLKEGVALFSELLGAKFAEPVELNIAGRKAQLAFSNIGLGIAQLEEPVEGLRAIGFKVGDLDELKAKLEKRGMKPVFEGGSGSMKEAQYDIYGMRFNFAEYKGVPISNRALSLQLERAGLI